jgi:hypothetical protein
MANIFLTGYCCEFAYVLNIKTGYPIWAILDSSGCCIAHAFVKIDKSTIIDAKGIRSLDEMKLDVVNAGKFKKINNNVELEVYGGQLIEEAIKQAEILINENPNKYII